jgi:hypothetical protein
MTETETILALVIIAAVITLAILIYLGKWRA